MPYINPQRSERPENDHPRSATSLQARSGSSESSSSLPPDLPSEDYRDLWETFNGEWMLPQRNVGGQDFGMLVNGVSNQDTAGGATTRFNDNGSNTTATTSFASAWRSGGRHHARQRFRSIPSDQDETGVSFARNRSNGTYELYLTLPSTLRLGSSRSVVLPSVAEPHQVDEERWFSSATELLPQIGIDLEEGSELESLLKSGLRRFWGYINSVGNA
ncbi:hypothetical protein L486_07700 [Kwoniella mangroviensis CBS 10435]|uniref:Uncharacterized protein n=1 Tax=Kwoniella mangroviensis CBS 10435 TaxID=1331196 RepID=A0A1B9IFW5_9TREE|nr:uncharacterized protein I203_05706 [Kwoniella mangroviensis CBS 8507]OCF54568.1 hypothetical protein L486_07700 [Kwoniella mangroviensis CBS 10435]OCF64964.1 hypothetical protein I203_05706 [Kwoniella mangroviensis CBS 8507]OCF78807.1 hypothetical protein I204_00751 [Kwoniella mangroviensis CBS 8886]